MREPLNPNLEREVARFAQANRKGGAYAAVMGHPEAAHAMIRIGEVLELILAGETCDAAIEHARNGTGAQVLENAKERLVKLETDSLDDELRKMLDNNDNQ